MDIPPQIPSPNDDDDNNDLLMHSNTTNNTNNSTYNTPESAQTQTQPNGTLDTKQIVSNPNRPLSTPKSQSLDIDILKHDNPHMLRCITSSAIHKNKKKKKKSKKRCAALDYLSDSPKKKRGRKVKDKKNMPPIQKQPFFLVFPDLRLKCPQCDHIAICQGTLVQHLRTHPASRKCPECNKIFSTQQNLIKHARLHTGERPYPCPIGRCRWAYKQKGDLLAHIQRGKHGTSSDNNRKPPPFKFYHGSTKLPTLHAISKQDVLAAPDLKQLIIALRKREEMKKKQKEKVKQKRKSQLDDFVLSMFLSIYDIDNHEMKNLLKIAKSKYKEKLLKQQMIDEHKEDEKRMHLDAEGDEEHHDDDADGDDASSGIDIGFGENEENYLKIDDLPNGKKVNIKFKYLVNRVYGDYSIVLVPVNSVPPDEIYEKTPEIVIDPKLIPALCMSDDSLSPHDHDALNESTPNGSSIPPPLKKQRLNNGSARSHHPMKELKDHHIILGKGHSLLGRVGHMHMPRKRQYHKYNQTVEGYWQCDAPNCGSLFLTKELLESHCKELHDSGYYGCKYCERIYRSQKNVQNHLKKAHGKHGDAYLNALIYNKFHQIIKLKESRWSAIRKNIEHLNHTGGTEIDREEEEKDKEEMEMKQDEEAFVTKCIVFKTHPIDNTILRQEHDSEKEDGDAPDIKKKKKLVPWTMQDKNKKSGRGRGRPRRVMSVDNLDGYFDVKRKRKRGRPRGRPKGSKNKPKNINNNTKKKRGRGRPKGSKNKKKKSQKRKKNKHNKEEMSVSEETDDTDMSSTDEEEDEEQYDSLRDSDDDEDFSLADYEIGTIHDDIDDGESIGTMSVCRDEQSILMNDLRIEKKYNSNKKHKDHKKHKKKRGRKRKRNEMSAVHEDEDGDINITDKHVHKSIIKTEPTPMRLGAVHIKPEHNGTNPQNILRLPTFDVPPHLPNITDLMNNDISLSSITNLFAPSQTPISEINKLSLPNNLDIPMPAMPSLNSTAAELNGLLNQIEGNNGNVDYNSIIESLLSSSSQRAPSDTAQSISSTFNNNAQSLNNNALLSPLNSHQSTINQLNQINTLNHLNNQLNNSNPSFNIAAMNNLLSGNRPRSSTHSSEEPIHPISTKNNTHKMKNDPLRNFFQNGAMLNNYGNIVNNNYLLKKLHTPQNTNHTTNHNNDNKDKDNSESPFVPPLVEAVCGATGCIKTKRDDGKPLLMCGRCFNIKYCSKRCQLAHIHEHRGVCKKKGIAS